MAKNEGIKTRQFALNQIYTVFDNITATGNTSNYYVYAAKPVAWPDEQTPPGVFESVDDSIFQTQQSLVFGKRISAENLRMMVQRNDWTANVTFDQYSQLDPELFDKKYHVVTDENKVYKILYNNLDNPSLIKPTLTQNNAFETSDGYVWKYMFTIPVDDMKRFSTPTHVPVAANANTINSARSGIDVIELQSSGSGYLCYVNGTVQSVVNDKIVQIDNYASQDNDFYTKSSFYVTNGPALGQLRNITKYVANSIGNFVYLDESIGVVPILTKYRIAPGVRIVGDGRGAQAICDVSENYGLKSIRIIAPGSGYTRARAVISTNTAYGSGATVQAFVPPPGGHGANPSYELGANTFAVSVKFNGTEANTIITEAAYRRYGILLNPKAFDGSPWNKSTFSNVMKITTSPVIQYRVGEKVTTDETLSESYVIHSNNSVTFLVGDKTIANTETIIAANGVTSTVNSIITPGDINPATPQILYINNTSPVPRTVNGDETVKILFTL